MRRIRKTRFNNLSRALQNWENIIPQWRLVFASMLISIGCGISFLMGRQSVVSMFIVDTLRVTPSFVAWLFFICAVLTPLMFYIFRNIGVIFVLMIPYFGIGAILFFQAVTMPELPLVYLVTYLASVLVYLGLWFNTGELAFFRRLSDEYEIENDLLEKEIATLKATIKTLENAGETGTPESGA